MTRNVGIPFILALVGILAVGPISITIYMPALPSVQREFGSDLHLVQLTLSLPLAAAIVAPAIVGWVSDVYGRRMVAIGSLITFLVCCAIAMQASSLWTLLIARTILGASATCAIVVGRAIISDMYEAKDLTAAMAKYSAVPVAAIMVAPVLGGWLTSEVGWRAIFVFLVAASAILLILTFFALHETVRRADTHGEGNGGTASARPSRVSYGTLLRSRAFIGYIGQSVFHFGVAVGFVAAVPYIVENRLGLDAFDGGLGLIAIVIGLLGGVLAAGKLADRVSGPSQVFWGSLIGLSGGISLYLVLGSAWAGLSVTTLFLPTTIAAIGIGFAMPGSQAGIVGTEPQLAGFASGLSSCLQLLMAAAFVHLVALETVVPETSLSIITAAGMGAAVLFSILVIVRPASPAQAADPSTLKHR